MRDSWLLAVQVSRVETRRQTELIGPQTSKDCLGSRSARPGTGQSDHATSGAAVKLLLRRTRPHGSAPVRRLQFRYSIYRIIGTPTNDPEGLSDAIPLIPLFP